MHTKVQMSLAAVALLAGAAAFTPVNADVGRECRGVAAGVVASMRANGEISGDAEVQAAVKAARRSCAAALEGFDSAELADAAESAEDGDDQEQSVWEALTRDRELKPGNERLRRLRN